MSAANRRFDAHHSECSVTTSPINRLSRRIAAHFGHKDGRDDLWSVSVHRSAALNIFLSSLCMLTVLLGLNRPTNLPSGLVTGATAVFRPCIFSMTDFHKEKAMAAHAGEGERRTNFFNEAAL